MTYTMALRTPFVTTLQSCKRLIGEIVRIRWVDEWGEAFYIGEITNTELFTGDETPESVVLYMIHPSSFHGSALIIPIGKELDLWLL